jgi:hypothetical protein
MYGNKPDCFDFENFKERKGPVLFKSQKSKLHNTNTQLKALYFSIKSLFFS